MFAITVVALSAAFLMVSFAVILAVYSAHTGHDTKSGTAAVVLVVVGLAIMAAVGFAL